MYVYQNRMIICYLHTLLWLTMWSDDYCYDDVKTIKASCDNKNQGQKLSTKIKVKVHSKKD